MTEKLHTRGQSRFGFLLRCDGVSQDTRRLIFVCNLAHIPVQLHAWTVARPPAKLFIWWRKSMTSQSTKSQSDAVRVKWGRGS